MNTTKKTQILIVGGGFAGTKAAVQLAGCDNCDVTLVSDHSHFRYYPGLYHTATGGKRAGSRIRLSSILEGSNVEFIQATATKLDRQNQQIITADRQKLPYDKLILALGNVTNYFGIKGLQEYSYSIKSTEEVERFKKHLHEQFIEKGGPDLNYVIVGGGPTGIELAGALPGYLRATMKKHGVKSRKLNIELVEAAPRLLPRAPQHVSRVITKRLRKLGIKLLLGTAVQGQTPDMLMAGGKPLQSHTVVWTAGVTNHPFFKDNGFKLTERGKVEVDDYLQAEQNIYVLGDNANTPFSGMAQTALHDGNFVAHNIMREAEHGDMPKSYTPKEPITVIPVGSGWASVQWGKRNFSGFAGWVLRLLADLIGFHDLQSWAKAGEQWLISMDEEELNCPNCTRPSVAKK
ncbi:MAG TPA: FAD-dependent oxidoreductase [Candidatus Saccharimonadales bacterium]|nr:FAD-dependent oxidoreductase [Candidatus Saccharimonadales bacterium]